MELIYILVIAIIVCITINNYILTLFVAAFAGYIIYNKKPPQKKVEQFVSKPDADFIDNADVVNNAFNTDVVENRKNYQDLDDTIAQAGIARGKRAETSRTGTVRSTVDTFAKYFVDQANIDESVDWINVNPDVDADPKFQPMYVK